MPVAVADSYSTAAGGSVYAGRAAPQLAWMVAATVNQWATLPNSAGSGGADVANYSGFVVDDKLRIWIAAAGGHQNYDNRVVKYDAGVDSPTGWSLVLPSSTSMVNNAPYMDDGRPAARHTYDYQGFDPATRRLFLIGCYGTYPQAGAANTIDALNVDTGLWDAAGTWPYTYGSTLSNAGSGTGGNFYDSTTGTFFWATKKFRPASGGNYVELNTTTTPIRMSNAYDTSRQAVFGMQWGDGWGAGSGLTCTQVLDPNGARTQRTITFSAGSASALATVQADTPANATMTYDSLRDKFCFAYGSVSSAGPVRLVEITPNASTVWDMAIITPTGSTDNIGPAGLCGRLKFVRSGSVGGYLFLPDKTSPLYFLRTA